MIRRVHDDDLTDSPTDRAMREARRPSEVVEVSAVVWQDDVALERLLDLEVGTVLKLYPTSSDDGSQEPKTSEALRVRLRCGGHDVAVGEAVIAGGAVAVRLDRIEAARGLLTDRQPEEPATPVSQEHRDIRERM